MPKRENNERNQRAGASEIHAPPSLPFLRPDEALGLSIIALVIAQRISLQDLIGPFLDHRRLGASVVLFTVMLGATGGCAHQNANACKSTTKNTKMKSFPASMSTVTSYFLHAVRFHANRSPALSHSNYDTSP